MSTSSDDDSKSLEGVRKQLDGLSKQLAELIGRLEEVKKQESRRGIRAVGISVVTLLVGFLVDILKG
ncbi:MULTISPECIES: hypothetical protein [Streptomyces]|uniref:hypothetical protein n=1 Tax=Streptomyces TaxID=1883 RepID=UPI001487FFE4|nr:MULTISPECIES: hypothetical protein [Streptomyces]